MVITIIKIVLAVIFTLSVIAKLTGKTKSTFEDSGYSPRLMYVIAIAEIVLTAGLFSWFEMISTIGLLGIMGGALYTLFRQKVPASKYILAILTTVLLIALLVIQITKKSLLP